MPNLRNRVRGTLSWAVPVTALVGAAGLSSAGGCSNSKTSPGSVEIALHDLPSTVHCVRVRSTGDGPVVSYPWDKASTPTVSYGPLNPGRVNVTVEAFPLGCGALGNRAPAWATAAPIVVEVQAGGVTRITADLIASATICVDFADLPGPVDPSCQGASTPDGPARTLCRAYKGGESNRASALSHVERRPSLVDKFTALTAAASKQIDDACVVGDRDYDAFALALQGGRVAFDSAAFQRCILAAAQAAQTATVHDYNLGQGELRKVVNSPDCTGAFKPLQGNAASCVQGWDCQDGLICQGDSSASTALKCLPPVALGAACGGNRVCGQGTDCRNGVCATRPTVGQACGREAGACADGLFCDRTAKCHAYVPAGQSCAGADDVCALGLTCVSGTCRDVGNALVTGAPCDPAKDRCQDYATTCRPTAPAATTFACLDRAGVGDPCFGDETCRIGLACSETTHRCESVFRAVGDACDAEGPCAIGAYCKSGECVAQLVAGAACTSTDVCSNGYCGSDGKCRGYPIAGEPCDLTATNAPPFCLDAKCIGGLCVAGKEFDSCAQDPAICKSGLYCASSLVCLQRPAIGTYSYNGVCAEGAYAASNGVCTAKKNAGDPCTTASECRTNLCDGTTCLPTVDVHDAHRLIESLALGF